MHRCATGLAAAALCSALALPAQAAGYRLTALPALTPGHNSFANTLAPSGKVLGDSYVPRPCPPSQWLNCLFDGFASQQARAVVWRSVSRPPTALACLGQAPGRPATDKPCEATGINGSGRLVGHSQTRRDTLPVPVLWADAASPPVDLSARLQSLPPFASARAVGINEQGWILGGAQSSGIQSEYAFVLREGVASALPSLGADSVQPVAVNSTLAVGNGQFEIGGQSGALIWSLATGGTEVLRTVDGSVNHVYAEGLSTAGHVTGFYWAPANPQGNKAFVWFQGRAQTLATLPDHSSHAYAVNAQGQVVGSHCTSRPGTQDCHATVWTNGERLDLNTMATPPAGYTLVQATGINDQGQISGWMFSAPKAYRAFVLTPQP
jgi:probable HAF family extracellular repeat protein